MLNSLAAGSAAVADVATTHLRDPSWPGMTNEGHERSVNQEHNSEDRYQPDTQQNNYRSHDQKNDRQGSDRQGGVEFLCWTRQRNRVSNPPNRPTRLAIFSGMQEEHGAVRAGHADRQEARRINQGRVFALTQDRGCQYFKPIVSEFQDVFPKELPRIPPIRDILKEFEGSATRVVGEAMFYSHRCDRHGVHQDSDLSRKGLNGKVIAYASRQLKPYEVNYPTHDRNSSRCLRSSKYWRHYLNGKSCRYFLSIKRVSIYLHSARIDKEHETLDGVTKRIKTPTFSTILVKLIVLADALSRKSGNDKLASSVEEEIICDLERLDIELCVREHNGFIASRQGTNYAYQMTYTSKALMTEAP
ncbi:reverse transcriptase [Tanacetum coccineum]